MVLLYNFKSAFKIINVSPSTYIVILVEKNSIFYMKIIKDINWEKCSTTLLC